MTKEEKEHIMNSFVQVNFVLTQFTALILAGLLRSSLSPIAATPAARHVYGLVIGLALGYFCFGRWVYAEIIPHWNSAGILTHGNFDLMQDGYNSKYIVPFSKKISGFSCLYRLLKQIFNMHLM